MPKLSAVVLVAMAFLATSINSVPIDRECMFEMQDKLADHQPVARQLQNSYGGFGGPPPGPGQQTGMDSNPGQPVNKHVAVVESSVAALGASVTAMQTTGTLQPAIHGTKELFNKGVQKVNATYHHTTEEVHNVTTSVERKTHKLLHPFSHNDKQEKTYKEEDKDHENYR